MSSRSQLKPMAWGEAPDLVGPRHVYRVRRLATLLESAVAHGKILDAGCGAGTLTEILAGHDYQVTAIDGSAQFVDHVRARVAQRGWSGRVQVVQMNLESADLPEAAFDGAVSGEVLEHLADDLGAARAICRSLKSGGTFALSVPAGTEQYDWLDRWAGHERRYDEQSLRRLLTDAGFHVDSIVRWGFPFMTAYERWVQRPGISRAARSGSERSLVARLARSAPVVWALGLLFSADQLFEGRSSRGTGLLARAHRP